MRMILAILLSCAMVACTSLGRLEQGASVVSPPESVFVLGVSPEGYRVMIFQGSLAKDGSFSKSKWNNANFAGHPDEGFVVASASAGQILALTDVTVVKDKETLLGARFNPCEGKMALTFTPDPVGGKVLYLGRVHFDRDENGLRPSFSTDGLESAKQYMAQHYPKLAANLQEWKYEMRPISDSCTRTIYIPAPPTSR